MAICLCNRSALLCWKSTGSLLGRLAGAPRTSKLSACSLDRRKDVDAVLEASGVHLHQSAIHLMVEPRRNTRAAREIVRHVRTAPLPSRAFVRLSDDVLVSSPELVFVELATEIDEVWLAQLGFELCGTYALSSRESAGFRLREEPLMTVESAMRFLDGCGKAKGVGRARRALRMVVDGSRSPMETALTLMLCAPRSVGGLGLEHPRLNWPVRTSDGVKYVDVCWPEHGFGLEYLGEEYHSGDGAEARDSRRESRLLASGMRIIDVRFEDVRNPKLFDQLANDVAALLGVRVRIRSDRFRGQQGLLRGKVLPAITEKF